MSNKSTVQAGMSKHVRLNRPAGTPGYLWFGHRMKAELVGHLVERLGEKRTSCSLQMDVCITNGENWISTSTIPCTAGSHSSRNFDPFAQLDRSISWTGWQVRLLTSTKLKEMIHQSAQWLQS